MLMDDLFYKISSGAGQDTRYRQSNLKSSIDSFVKNKSLPFNGRKDLIQLTCFQIEIWLYHIKSPVLA